jgi:cytoskeletal protein CcmA (bactofilin family)
MGLFNKNKGRRFADNRRFETTLAAGTEFIGDLSGGVATRVDGRVVGNGDLQGMLLVGVDCTWEGNITADEVIVEGRVDGDIVARKRLELLSGARVTGDIRCPVITMDVGAICEGQIHMQDASNLTTFKDQRDS